jgi:hypothetical protein
MAVGDYIQVDFKGLVNLSQVVLNNSSTSGGDYPASVGVYTSQDGSSFSTTPVGTANGASGKTTINFTTVNVRAIRVKVTGTRSNWWSIGELQTDCNL